MLATLAAAVTLTLAPDSPARGASGPEPRPVLVLPVPQSRLVRLASIPNENWRPGHRGVDIAALPGDDVVAPGSGQVIFAGPVAGRDVITIRLDVGINATLEPVLATVAVGERVARGDVVGTVTDAASHCAPSTCTHWGLKYGERYLDPLDWLVGFGPVVLLPDA